MVIFHRIIGSRCLEILIADIYILLLEKTPTG